MNLGIVGSRNFNNRALMIEQIYKVLPEKFTTHDNVIVTGDARGADALARMEAIHLGLEVIVHRADWDKWGKVAGPIRNQKIVNDSDALIAFPSKHGRGTQITMKMARIKKIPVYVVDNWEGEEE